MMIGFVSYRSDNEEILVMEKHFRTTIFFQPCIDLVEFRFIKV